MLKIKVQALVVPSFISENGAVAGVDVRGGGPATRRDGPSKIGKYCSGC